jgi:hypothetical protein
MYRDRGRTVGRDRNSDVPCLRLFAILDLYARGPVWLGADLALRARAGVSDGFRGRPLRTEAVAQRNRGVRRSQSRHEPILTDVLYGSLGAFDGLAELI